MNVPARLLGSVCALLLAFTTVWADSQDADDGDETGRSSEKAEEGTPEERKAALEERVQVIGSAEAAKETSGSAQYIDAEELVRHQHSDIHRVLRRVPGVYLQDEEGYGLRPNIGMRGTGVERSQKITLMEDGTLIAPAPYSAPAAYYFPTVGRMSAVEIIKGPASIEEGPYTNGGVVNLVSTPIPMRLAARADLALGEDDHLRSHASAGNSHEHFGWLLEGYRQRTDGFKRLDGGGDTGFDLEDYLGKLRLSTDSKARIHQSLELKLGSTEQLGHETYLGLTPEDFERDPYRRYAASALDRIDTDHEQAQLRYFLVPASRVDLTVTAYDNEFDRNWRKIERVDGATVASVLANPSANADRLATLRGTMDSDPSAIAIRNNRRAYHARGIQTQFGLRVGPAGARHELEMGLRYHEDQEDRFQEEDGYRMVSGTLELTSSGVPGSNANRVASARALAFFARDTIPFGRWTFTPGARIEDVEFTQRDFGTADPERTATALVTRRNDVSELIPGMGIDYKWNERFRTFGGIHRGLAPPGPGQDADTRPEESLNYEAGARFSGGFDLQAVAFYNDYDNLLGSDTTSGGGTGSGELFNGGRVEVAGLELSLSDDLLGGREDVAVPFQLAYTYSRATFRSSFVTSFEDWAPEVAKGDELPYMPENQLYAEIGYRAKAWGVFLGASYVDEMRTKAGRGAIPDAERIEDHLVFDVSGEYKLHTHYRAFLQVRNVADEVYVAARRPAGLRPGLPRTLLAGFGVQF